MKRLTEAVIVLFVGLIFAAQVEAINVTQADVQNGLAVVAGNKAAKSSTITWDGLAVTATNKGGAFNFAGPVPQNCVGVLSDGLTTINVTLSNCMKASGIQIPVAKTGQTQCWDILGVQIACTGTGQDGEFQAGVSPPSPRFTDSADGTVRDNATGLIWLKDGGQGVGPRQRSLQPC